MIYPKLQNPINIFLTQPISLQPVHFAARHTASLQLQAFGHPAARVVRYSIPLRCIPYRATLAFPNAHPNAGKAVFVSRSVLFRKTYLQGCNKLPSVALAYTVHFPARLRSSRCSLTAVHLFCFTHSLLPHSQLLHPPKPHLRCSLHSQYFLLGVCRCLLFLLACGSLRADRAVMLFAVNPVPTVASFQSLVPLSFHSATFSTPLKSSSFTSLNKPTRFHYAIRLFDLQLVFDG